MTDQPTEGWPPCSMYVRGPRPCHCTTPCQACPTPHPGWGHDTGWSHYAYGPPAREREEWDGLVPCGACDGDLWVWEEVLVADVVSVVESDRRRDEAVLAERNRFLAIVDAHRPTLGDGLTEMLLAAIAAGIESGEPA